jgi:hypothetical protein
VFENMNPNSLVVIGVGFRLENQSYISDRHKIPPLGAGIPFTRDSM